MCRSNGHVRWITFLKLPRSRDLDRALASRSLLIRNHCRVDNPPFAAGLAALWASVWLIEHKKQVQGRYALDFAVC